MQRNGELRNEQGQYIMPNSASYTYNYRAGFTMSLLIR